MSIDKRAGQFAPFAALTGYDEEIEETARLTTKKHILDEESINKINENLNIIKENVNSVILKSGIPATNIDFCFAGDLLNQCISSSFGLRELNMPFFGVFGACSTFVESMCLGSVFIASGAASNVLCATSSHFCSAEKQFRFPLELGNQRPPTSQWTVTGSGAAVLSSNGIGPKITYITPRKNC